jgi:exodeoxyribonuclease VII large subunit
MDPQTILKKGFAMLYYNGSIMPAAKGIPVGAEVTIRMSDATMEATVNAKNKVDGESDV